MIIIVGNKIDYDEHRIVSTIDAKKYADDNQLLYKECSAKTGHNINNVFEDAYNIICTQIDSTYDINTNIHLDEQPGINIGGCFGTVFMSISSPFNYLYDSYYNN